MRLVSVSEHGQKLAYSKCFRAAKAQRDQCRLLLLRGAHGTGDRGQCVLAASPLVGKEWSKHPTPWLGVQLPNGLVSV